MSDININNNEPENNEVETEQATEEKSATVSDAKVPEKGATAAEAKAKKRKLRIMAWALVIAIIAAIIPINLLADSLGVSWDMTPEKYYTIDQTTKNVLSSLNTDITIYFLYNLEDVEASRDTLALAKILRQYDSYEHVSVVDFDLSERPDLAAKANPDDELILTEGDIVVVGNGLSKKISGSTLFQTVQTTSALTFVGENYITGAIQYCLNGEKPMIYFLEGHGERTIEENYSQLSTLLRTASYSVASLSLSDFDAVPDDCKILIVGDPQQDIDEQELDKLEKYFDKGGSVCFLMGPNSDAVNYTNIEILLREFGLGINYDKVEETGEENFAADNPANLKVNFADTTYTTLTDAFLSGDTGDAYFPNSRSVFSVNTANSKNLKIDLLIKCLDTETALTIPCGGEGKDVDEEYGVPYLAFSSFDNSRSSGLKDAQVLLFGSADFVDDLYIESEYVQSTMLLFFSGISWLYSNDVDMDIADATQNVDFITIKEDKTGDRLLIIIGAIPILVAIAGFIVWTRRRNS